MEYLVIYSRALLMEHIQEDWCSTEQKDDLELGKEQNSVTKYRVMHSRQNSYCLQ